MYRPENLMLVVFNLFYFLLIIHFINSLLECLNCVICWLAPLKNLEFKGVCFVTVIRPVLEYTVIRNVIYLCWIPHVWAADAVLFCADESNDWWYIYIYCFNTKQSAMFYLLLVIVHFTKTCLFKSCNMLINTAGKSWVQLCLFCYDRKTRARTQSHTRCYVSMINPACWGCWRAAILRWAV